MKTYKKYKIILIISILAMIGIASLMILTSGEKKETILYKEFLSHLENENVEQVILTDNGNLQFRLKNSNLNYETDNPKNPQLKEQLLIKGITVKDGKGLTVESVLQILVSLAFIIAIIFIGFGRRKYAKTAVAYNVSPAMIDGFKKTTFKDVAGNEEAKDSVRDIVDFIKNPEKYAKFGARMPSGIILYGPPGTGKTLMAKAIAGEAGVPFFAVCGSDFVQMYVGVGASRIRDLFKKAREYGKAVIFIDEIDAIGKKRGATPTGANDEREQTLNALLTQMSGFNTGTGIVVLAATNRLDTLDEALLRPGRFDRQVEIALPDLNARRKILEYHANNKPLSEEIDMGRLAKDSIYFSGAMLENLMNESAIVAAKRNNAVIEQKDIEKAFFTIMAGMEKLDRTNIMQKDREITAYHEAGHALASKVATPDSTVSKISIIPSTKGTGGFCISIPQDKMYYTKRDLECMVMVNLAGRAAEELKFGTENITTGASNDIERASGIIRDYVAKYGMSNRIGLLNMGQFHDSGGMLEECYNLINNLYEITKEMLTNNMDTLDAIATTLLEKETLSENELDIIINLKKSA